MVYVTDFHFSLSFDIL